VVWRVVSSYPPAAALLLQYLVGRRKGVMHMIRRNACSTFPCYLPPSPNCATTYFPLLLLSRAFTDLMLPFTAWLRH